MDVNPQDEALARRLAAALRDSEQNLDAVTRARLAAARARAVAAAAPPAWRGWALPAALAAGLAVYAVLPLREAAPVRPAEPALALELMADELGPEFYRDLDFYQWLQTQPAHA